MSRSEWLDKQLQGVSTADFLGRLDYDQLLSARNMAEGLLKKKDEETRVRVWIVSGDVRNVGGFLEPNYAEAVERAHQALDEEAKTGRGFTIMVELESRRESEVPELLALKI